MKFLGDIYNNRRSFLQFVNEQRTENKSVTFEHINVNSDVLLEQAIKPSNHVVYFTHDYFNNVMGKNQHLEHASEVCHAYNVEKFMTVAPIEFTNYYEWENAEENPIEKENQVHDKILDTFSTKEGANAFVMRVNLAFGSNSYLVRYLTQNWLSNHSAFNADKHKHFRFNPVHYNDLNNMLHSAFNSSGELNGKRFHVNGPDAVTFQDVNNLVKQAFHKTSTHSSPNPLIYKANIAWQLFFNGNNHINNMVYMQ